jgi:hypothetical protein
MSIHCALCFLFFVLLYALCVENNHDDDEKFQLRAFKRIFSRFWKKRPYFVVVAFSPASSGDAVSRTENPKEPEPFQLIIVLLQQSKLYIHHHRTIE